MLQKKRNVAVFSKKWEGAACTVTLDRVRNTVLGNESTGHPVKCEFHINDKYAFSITVLHVE